MYQIRAGLGGGFGGCESHDWIDSEAPDEETAEKEAYELAVEEYDSYAGLYGLRSIQDIMEEEDIDEVEAEEIYQEEMEAWLTYEIREI